MITADDVIMALSWSGEQPEMKNLITYAKRFRIPLVAMTAESESTLSKAADIALTLPKAREACPHNLAPTTSSLMMLALGDALAIALLEGRGFTSVDFSVLHPGGKLGAMLKYARDLMHSGDAVPLKPLGTRMSDALVEMSSKGFGCVGIVDARGAIVGIVTDGDLRRHMRPDLMTALVDDVMTKNPKTIPRDLLASEALEILNSSKITALIVTDANRPVRHRAFARHIAGWGGVGLGQRHHSAVIASSASDEAIQSSFAALDCFAEPVVGRAFRATRWLAITATAETSPHSLPAAGAARSPGTTRSGRSRRAG